MPSPRGNAIRAGAAYVEVFLDDTPFVRGVRVLGNSIRHLARQFTIGGLFAVAAGTAILLPFKDFATQAGNATEILTRFQAVFLDLAPEASKFADILARAANRSSLLLKDALGLNQALTRGFGFDPRTALEMSKVLTRLTLDFASFYDRPEPEIQQVLLSAIAGEEQAVRRLGVSVYQSSVNAELLRLGFKGGAQNATQMQKVVARFNLILQSAARSNVIGDVFRTAQSFNNQIRALSAAWLDFRVAMGNTFRTAAAGAVGVLANILRWMAELAKNNPELVQKILKLGIALLIAGKAALVVALILRTTSFVLGTLLKPLDFLFNAAKRIGPILLATLRAPISLITTVIRSMIGMVLFLPVALAKAGIALVIFGIQMGAMLATFIAAATLIAPFVLLIGGLTVAMLGSANVLKGLSDAYRGAVNGIRSVLGSLRSAVTATRNVLIQGWTGLNVAIITSFRPVVTYFQAAFAYISDVFSTTMEGMRDAIAAGDLGIAAKILWSGLKVLWLSGVIELKAIWRGFILYFLLQMAKMKPSWINAKAFILTQWVSLVEQIKLIWTTVDVFLKKGLISIERGFLGLAEVINGLALAALGVQRALFLITEAEYQRGIAEAATEGGRIQAERDALRRRATATDPTKKRQEITAEADKERARIEGQRHGELISATIDRMIAELNLRLRNVNLSKEDLDQLKKERDELLNARKELESLKTLARNVRNKAEKERIEKQKEFEEKFGLGLLGLPQDGLGGATTTKTFGTVVGRDAQQLAVQVQNQTVFQLRQANRYLKDIRDASRGNRRFVFEGPGVDPVPVAN